MPDTDYTPAGVRHFLQAVADRLYPNHDGAAFTITTPLGPVVVSVPPPGRVAETPAMPDAEPDAKSKPEVWPRAHLAVLRDVSIVLAATGHRLSTTPLMDALERAGYRHGDGTMRAAMSAAVRANVLTNETATDPIGYGLPRWGRHGGEKNGH